MIWRYLVAAIEIGVTYRDTQRTGGPEEDGRWPFRVRPSDGFVQQDYTSHLIPAIQLLEELERRTLDASFGVAAQRAWAWLENNPMNPASVNFERWEGFYEDIGPESAGLGDHYGAEATAVALIERNAPGDLERAIAIRDWSTSVFLAPDGVQNGSGFYTWSIREWQAWMNTTYAATAQWGVPATPTRSGDARHAAARPGVAHARARGAAQSHLRSGAGVERAD